MPEWLLFGGATTAVVAVLAAGWRYVVWVWQQASAFLIGRCEFDHTAGPIVLAYLVAHARQLPVAVPTYGLYFWPVKFQDAQALIGFEKLSLTTRIFLVGRTAVFVSPGQRVKMQYLRGTFNPRKFLKLAAADKEQEVARLNSEDKGASPRFEVRTITGRLGEGKEIFARVRPASPGAMLSDGPVATGGGNDSPDWFGERRYLRPLWYDWSVIGHRPDTRRNPMGELALSPEALTVVQDLKHWRQAREWYEARGIPWRTAVLGYGDPGNGKTAFFRALAWTLNCPLLRFDLSTMTNRDLIDQWDMAVDRGPAIILLEDIDAVYHGRERQSGETTFDCLLNVWDGVKESPGIIVGVTTNKPEHLDEALADVSQEGPSRPGRIDFVLRFDNPSREGRRLIVSKILSDWPELVEETVDETDGQSGAQIEARCIQIAREKFWGSARRKTTVS